MTDWVVAIAGNAADLQELEKSVVGPELRVTQKFGSYVLEAAEFAPHTDPQAVRRRADQILEVLSGAARIAFGLIEPLSSTWVAKTAPDGTKQIFMHVTETITLRDTVSVTITRADGTIEQSNPADPVRGMTATAMRYQAVATVLSAVARGDKDWVNLYRIYEQIADNVGGDDAVASLGWCSKTVIRSFKHTANSPAAIGHAARHGVDTGSPPTKPMELGAATALIHDLVQKWVRSKV